MNFEQPFAEAVHDRAWHDAAKRLAAWALERVFVRTDRFGGYYVDGGGEKKTVTRPNKSTPNAVNTKLLEQHFRATDISHVVGSLALTAAGNNSTGKWIAVDIDAHSDADDPDRNKKYAEHLFAKFVGLGFQPLACHWGTGGFHVWAFFSGDVPGAILHSFARWLVKDAATAPWNYPADIETFPKQAEVKEGKFGNWIRVPGRHHTKQRFAQVFNGAEWVAGEPAVANILGCTGDAPELIPDEARPGTKAPSPSTSNSNLHHDHRDDVFAEFNRRTGLDTVVKWHTDHGHRVVNAGHGRVDLVRIGKDGSSQSFNVMDRDGCVVTYSFSNNAGMPDHVGLTAAQVRCLYETGSCDTAAMAKFADVLRAEFGWPRRRSPRAVFVPAMPLRSHCRKSDSRTPISQTPADSSRIMESEYASSRTGTAGAAGTGFAGSSIGPAAPSTASHTKRFAAWRTKRLSGFTKRPRHSAMRRRVMKPHKGKQSGSVRRQPVFRFSDN